jgi:hypothetical protein
MADRRSPFLQSLAGENPSGPRPDVQRSREYLEQFPLDFDGLRTPTRRRADPSGPPTLFVHKRKRDGQIEKLARKDEPPKPGAVTNGAAAPNGAASSSPAE